MPLTVDFSIEQTRFYQGQDPKCKITLKNTGEKDITLLHPGLSNATPIWHIFNVGTGESVAHTNRDSIFRKTGLLELEPDETFEREYRLIERTPISLPGEYDISVELQWNDGKFSTTSESIRVTVAPLLARNLSAVSLNGGICTSSLLLWLRPKEDKWQFMAAEAKTLKKPEISRMSELKDIASPVRPVMAISKNQSFTSKKWIAWFDKSSLVGFRISSDSTSMKTDGPTILSPEFPAIQTKLFGPLLPVPELGSDGEAAAAVLSQTTDDGKSNLQVALIDKSGEVTEGPVARIQGGTASWGRGLALSTGERRVYVAAEQSTDEGDFVTLQELAWPLKAAEMEHIGQAKIEGAFVSGAISINADDHIHGGILVRVSPAEGNPRLTLHHFSRIPDGKLEMGDPIDMAADPAPAVTESRMVVNGTGKVFGMLRDAKGEWLAYSSYSDKLGEVPNGATLLTGAMDILLVGRPAEQSGIIIYAAPGIGFRFMLPSGRTDIAGPDPAPPPR